MVCVEMVVALPAQANVTALHLTADVFGYPRSSTLSLSLHTSRTYVLCTCITIELIRAQGGCYGGAADVAGHGWL